MAVELHAVGNSAPSCRSTSMIAPTARAQIGLRVGDPMPRIMLREVGGSVFDSWHQANAGRTQVYWIDPSLVGSVAEDLAARLAACDAELHLVVSASPLPPARQRHRVIAVG